MQRWRTLCIKLAEERRLYLDTRYYDSSNTTTLSTWQDLYKELWRMRGQFANDASAQPEPERRTHLPFPRVNGPSLGYSEAEAAAAEALERDAAAEEEGEEGEEEGGSRTFSIGVCVRFKPLGRWGSSEASKGLRQKVVIPLHQRMALVKAKFGLNLTNSEAMKKIMQMDHGPGALQQDPWAGAFLKEEDPKSHSASPEALGDPSQKENVPGGGGEKKAGGHGATLGGGDSEAGIVAIRPEDASVLALVPSTGLREFKFDKVFAAGCSQGHVHAQSSRKVVMDFLNGFNGTVMVYGQTGSGKTFTMFGPSQDLAGGSDSGECPAPAVPVCELDGPQPSDGIAQMTCREILGALRGREDALGIGWRLAVTYVEVYGQDVYDLLKQGQVVGQSRVAGQRYVLDGQTEWPVTSLAEIYEYLREGDAQKRKACTAMNERSSRAHTVFVLSLTQTVPHENPALGLPAKKITSKLMLVDLGGSEKLTKSKVHDSVKSAGSVPWDVYVFPSLSPSLSLSLHFPPLFPMTSRHVTADEFPPSLPAISVL